MVEGEDGREGRRGAEAGGAEGERGGGGIGEEDGGRGKGKRYSSGAADARPSTDGTPLPPTSEDGRIIAVLQHTALQPLAENNGALRGDRRHFMWFAQNETKGALVPITYRIPELDQEGAEKVSSTQRPRARQPSTLFPSPSHPPGKLEHRISFPDTTARRFPRLLQIQVLIPQVYRWRWPLDCGGKNRVFPPAIPPPYFKGLCPGFAETGAARRGCRGRDGGGGGGGGLHRTV